jgi:hypothetical protein
VETLYGGNAVTWPAAARVMSTTLHRTIILVAWRIFMVFSFEDCPGVDLAGRTI